MKFLLFPSNFARNKKAQQTLRDVQASAASLWSTAAEQRGDTAAAAPTSAAEPLTMHPYYVPVFTLNRWAQLHFCSG